MLGDSCVGVWCCGNEPFYTAIFNFPTPHQFALLYGTGIDCVPRIVSHLTISGSNKIIGIEYDAPCIKGLPVRVKIDDTNQRGEVVHREILSSDGVVYTGVAEGKPIKTSTEDALQDPKLLTESY